MTEENSSSSSSLVPQAGTGGVGITLLTAEEEQEEEEGPKERWRKPTAVLEFHPGKARRAYSISRHRAVAAVVVG